MNDHDDPVGDELVHGLLAEIEEDERLSELVGVNLMPAGHDPSHAPRVLPSLEDWLRRAEEAARFLLSKSRSTSTDERGAVADRNGEPLSR